MTKDIFKTFHLLKKEFKKASSQSDYEQETMRKEHKKWQKNITNSLKK